MEVHVTLTTLAVFVILFIIFLIGLLFYLYPAGKSSSIPGPNPSDAAEGNISDIRKAGSLQEYLRELHDEHGQVTAFWHGTKTIVSISNLKEFAPRNQVFEVPSLLFEGWRPLVGDSSYIFAQGVSIFTRHDQLDFKMDPKTREHYGTIFTKISKELVKKWSSLPEGQHIHLTQHLKGFATKAVCRMLLGDYFDDDAKVIKLHKAWEHCWTYVESLGSEKDPISLEKDFKKNLSDLKKLLEEAMEKRFENQKAGGKVLLDGILTTSKSVNEKQLVSDAITQLTIGMLVTHSVLLWLVYFMATHSKVQEKLRKELKNTGSLEIMPESIGKMKYLRNIIQESVRCGSAFSWAGRKQDIDINFGGHLVSKNTPVIEAIGEAMQDEEHFCDPSLFDPGRFSNADKKASEPVVDPLAYIPFAFGGNRKNPEDSLVYLLAAILICNITRKLKISIAGDSAQNLFDPDYSSFVSRPSKEELWATVSLTEKNPEIVGKK